MKKLYKISTILGIAIITLLGVMFLVNKEMLLLASDDMSFHVMTAQGFIDNGGVTWWENWESNPLGRAHTYPPVYHIFIATVTSLGVTSVQLFFWVAFIATIGLLTVSWWSLKKIFNPLLSLLFLLLVTADATVINMLSITTPASIVLFSSPLLLVLFKNKKNIAAGLLLTLFWYTHMIFPYVIAFALGVWAWKQRVYVKPVAKALAVSYIAYLPWLVHLIMNHEFLRYFHPSWPDTFNLDKVASINAVLVGLFIISLVVIVTKLRKQAGYKDMFFFFGIILASSPLLLVAPLRFFSSMGAWAMLVCSAFFLTWVAANLKTTAVKIVFACIFIVLIGVYPVYTVNLNSGATSMLIDKNIFLQGIRFVVKGEGHEGMLLRYAFTEQNIELANTINTSTNRNQPILNISSWFNLIQYYDHVKFIPAQFFAALANRPMINARYPENQWYEQMPIVQAPIVLADYQQTNQFPGKKSEYEQRLANVLDDQFEVIGEADRLVAFKNKNQRAFTIQPVKNKVPLPFAWLLLYGSIFYISRQLYLLKNK